MQQTEQTASWGGAERKRVEAVVETLATLRSAGENLAEVAHDARNMVTALGLYCDLLDEPGVLATPYTHYGNELRLVAAASRRLVEKLVALDTHDDPMTASMRAQLRQPGRLEINAGSLKSEPAKQPNTARRWDLMPGILIDSLAGELLANRNLLAALAGPAITLSVDAEGGRLAVRLTGEDLTRVLVNLVKNAAEAMPQGGRIQLSVREKAAEAGTAPCLLLTIEDNGPGIPGKALDKIFEPGFSTNSITSRNEGWAAARRGLGLSITRSIIEAAGGRIFAGNCAPRGARLAIELPVRMR
jgi:signal transduction histidine kinase